VYEAEDKVGALNGAAAAEEEDADDARRVSITKRTMERAVTTSSKKSIYDEVRRAHDCSYDDREMVCR